MGGRAYLFLRLVALLPLILLIQVGCTQRSTTVSPDDLANAKNIVDLRNAGEPVRLTETTDEEVCNFLKKNLTSDYSLESIVVPEDWSDSTSAKIQISYYYSKEKMGKGLTPVVFFNGGPGGASAGSYQAMVLKKKEKLSAFNDVNFVFIDQRGNGCSSRYPDVQSAADIMRLRHYTSRSIVKDAEAIRLKIWGSRPWKVFGQSYGGLIVRRYLEMAPESVVSAHSHGQAITLNASERLSLRIQSQEKVLQDYFKEFPEDRLRLQTISDTLTEKRCFTDGVNEVCGNELLSSFVGDLGFQGWLTMNEDIGALYSAIKYHPNSWQSERAWLVFAAYYIVKSSEVGPGVVSKIEMQYQGASCNKTYETLKQMGEEPKNWLVHECLGYFKNDGSQDLTLTRRDSSLVQDRLQKFVDDEITEAISQLPRDEFRLGGVLAQMSARPGFQFFSYSGAYDTFVPAPLYKYENETMLGKYGNYHYFHFPESGHNGFADKEKVALDLLQ